MARAPKATEANSPSTADDTAASNSAAPTDTGAGASEGAAGAAAPTNTEGASGTAREAPSADSGDAVDEVASGTQSAPPPSIAFRVTSRVAGFRRFGRAWPDTPVDVLEGDHTREELNAMWAALKADPNFILDEDVDP